MRASIDFDDELGTRSYEIDDVATERYLAEKRDAKLPGANRIPQHLCLVARLFRVTPPFGGVARLLRRKQSPDTQAGQGPRLRHTPAGKQLVRLARAVRNA